MSLGNIAAQPPAGSSAVGTFQNVTFRGTVAPGAAAADLSGTATDAVAANGGGAAALRAALLPDAPAAAAVRATFPESRVLLDAATAAAAVVDPSSAGSVDTVVGVGEGASGLVLPLPTQNDPDFVQLQQVRSFCCMFFRLGGAGASTMCSPAALRRARERSISRFNAQNAL